MTQHTGLANTFAVSLECVHTKVTFTIAKIDFVWFRLYLAAMHFNENVERPQRKTAKGKRMNRLVFPKAKRGGGYTVKQVKPEPTMCKFKNIYIYFFFYYKQVQLYRH